MNCRHLFRAALVFCAALAACSPGGDLPLLQQTTEGPYHLGTGDELRLIVYGEKQLSGEFLVNDQGDVSLPLLGQSHAADLTPEQFADEVVGGLRDHRLILNPSVSVDVIRYRPIYILGEVEHPGSFPFSPGLTMLSAVALAGGFTYRGVTDTAQVVRTRNGHALRARIKPDSFLEPGDVLTIYERFF